MIYDTLEKLILLIYRIYFLLLRGLSKKVGNLWRISEKDLLAKCRCHNVSQRFLTEIRKSFHVCPFFATPMFCLRLSLSNDWSMSDLTWRFMGVFLCIIYCNTVINLVIQRRLPHRGTCLCSIGAISAV